MNFYSALTNCISKWTGYYTLVIFKIEILWNNCLGSKLKKLYPSYKLSHSKKSFFTGLLKNIFFRKYCISKFLICWLMWKGQQASSSILIRYTPFRCTNPQSPNCKLILKACDSNFLQGTDVSPYNHSPHFCALFEVCGYDCNTVTSHSRFIFI